MRIMNNAAILVLTLLLFSCTMGGIVNISEPYIADPKWSLDSGVLVLQDIEISVKPETYKVGILTVGLILPVIPLGSGNDFDRQSHNLLVTIQFKTLDDYISITPIDTILQIYGQEISPTLHSGVLTKITQPHEAQKAPSGHSWICETTHAELSSKQIDQDLILESKSCIVLEFPVITPETDTKFTIEFKGLKKNGLPLTVPNFNFKPGSTASYTVMG